MQTTALRYRSWYTSRACHKMLIMMAARAEAVLSMRQAGYHSSAVGAIRQVAFRKAGETRAFFEQLIALDEAEHRQCAPAPRAAF